MSERMTGGQAVVEALRLAGVTHAFGVPGESFLEVLDSFYDSPIRFVATRHEGGAAFMSSGFAKLSGMEFWRRPKTSIGYFCWFEYAERTSKVE